MEDRINLGEVADPAPTPTSARAAAPRRKDSTAAAVKLIPDLLDAMSWGGTSAQTEALNALACALSETHPAISKRLIRSVPKEMARRAQMPADLIAARQPVRTLQSMTLDANVLNMVQSLCDEHRRGEELRTWNLLPRHRVLLQGPPGNGKTLLAEALAHELGTPFFTVRYGATVDSHLGGTSKNIERIVEFASTLDCLLFFDEFDGVATQRGAGNDVGEARRITNHLLMTLDSLPNHVLFVAATNSPDLLDKAISRRFDTVIDIGSPSIELRQACAVRELTLPSRPDIDITHYAERVARKATESLSAVVTLCQQLRRDRALNEGRGIETLLKV